MARIIWRTGRIAVVVLIPLVMLVAILWLFHIRSLATTDGDALQTASAEELLAEAYALEKCGSNAEARNTYVFLAEMYPDSEEAGRALVALAGLLRPEFESDAGQVWSLALAAGPDHTEYAAEAVLAMAQKYVTAGKPAEALATYQGLINAWPNSGLAARVQAGIAVCQVQMRDHSAAQSSLDELFLRYGSDPSAAEGAFDVALEWSRKGKHTLAETLASRITMEWPAFSGRTWGQAALAMVALKSQRPGEARQYTMEFLNTPNRDEQWPKAAHRLGEVYVRMHKQPDLAAALCEQAAWSYSSVVPFGLSRDLALAQINAGNLSKAEDAVDSLILDYPDSTELARTLNRIADRYEAKGNTAYADGISLWILENWPRPTNEALTSMTRLTRCAIAQGRAVDAEGWLGQMLSEYPEHPWLPGKLLSVGQAYQSHGRLAQAQGVFEQLLTTWPDDRERSLASLAGLAACYAADGNPQQAREVLLRIQRDYDANVGSSRLEIARAYRESDYLEEAESVSQAVQQSEASSQAEIREAICETALCRIAQGRYAEAQDCVKQMTLEFEGDSRLAVLLGDVALAYRGAGQWEEALAVYEQLEGYAPLAARTGTAICRIHLGNAEAGQAIANEIVQEFGDSFWLPVPERLVNIAVAHRQAGNLTEAIDLYEYVEEYFPQDPMVLWSQLGRFACYLAQEDTISADVLCANMKEQFAGDPRCAVLRTETAAAYQHHGSVLASQEDPRANDYFTLAAQEARQAIAQATTASELAEAHLVLGNACRRLNDAQGALDAYQAALQYSPRHKLAWHMWFLIGRGYQELEAEGVLSSRQGAEATTAAYRQIVEVFPRCPAFRAAQDWLKAYSL